MWTRVYLLIIQIIIIQIGHAKKHANVSALWHYEVVAQAAII